MMTRGEKIKKIAQHYGYDAQSRQCIEECAELTQAINKFWRKQLKCGEKSFPMIDDVIFATDECENIIEEIVDIQIMLWQMVYFFGVDIIQIIDEKLDRQLARMEGENAD